MSKQLDADEWFKNTQARTRRARLVSASADTVYSELRDFAKNELKKSRFIFGPPDEVLEMALLGRNEPLIDLALAEFGLQARIVAELWKRTNQGFYKNDHVRKGVRLGCLSNCLAPAVNFSGRIISMEDLKLLFMSDDTDEQEAVLTNDSIASNLLVALYEHKEPFAEVSDRDWMRMVIRSSRNGRLNPNEDSDSGPDLEHWHIHKALFSLLETAPVTEHWVVGLTNVFETLNPAHVASVESGRIRDVLKRWEGVEVKDFKGELQAGYFSGLSMADEFRCLIAALYGRTYEDKKVGTYGSPTANDVAERCAYYGNAKMTAEEVSKYLQAEPNVFLFAAILNCGLLLNRQLRLMIEEGAGGRDFRYRYLKMLHHLNAGRPNYNIKPTAEWLLDEDEFETPNAVVAEPAAASKVEELDAKVVALGKQVATIKSWVGWVLLIVAVSAIARAWK